MDEKKSSQDFMPNCLMFIYYIIVKDTTIVKAKKCRKGVNG